MLASAQLHAADVDVVVTGPDGHGVRGIVIVAESAIAVGQRESRTAVMDQRNLQFVPDILVVQTGTAVDFPNSDQVKHQVYSFSGAKSFKLSLYAGHEYPPIVFDRAGLVTLGCNIHDNMIGYIYVTDSPYFGRTDASGHLLLHDLPRGSYTLVAWHSQIHDAPGGKLEQPLAVADATVAAAFHLKRAVKTEVHPMENMRWADY